jgi:hypothetical protein
LKLEDPILFSRQGLWSGLSGSVCSDDDPLLPGSPDVYGFFPCVSLYFLKVIYIMRFII